MLGHLHKTAGHSVAPKHVFAGHSVASKNRRVMRPVSLERLSAAPLREAGSAFLPNLTKGQQAMIAAKAVNLVDSSTRQLGRAVDASHEYVNRARTVLAHAPDLADAVVSGSLPLNTAYEQVGSAEPTLSGLRTPFAAQAQEIKAARGDAGLYRRHAHDAPARSTADRSGRAGHRTGSSSQAQRPWRCRAGCRAGGKPRRSHQSRSSSRRT